MTRILTANGTTSGRMSPKTVEASPGRTLSTTSNTDHAQLTTTKQVVSTMRAVLVAILFVVLSPCSLLVWWKVCHKKCMKKRNVTH